MLLTCPNVYVAPVVTDGEAWLPPLCPLPDASGVELCVACMGAGDILRLLSTLTKVILRLKRLRSSVREA